MVLKLFTTFIVVAAILASPKHRDFTWSYRSSIYRVHWFMYGSYRRLQLSLNGPIGNVIKHDVKLDLTDL